MHGMTKQERGHQRDLKEQAHRGAYLTPDYAARWVYHLAQTDYWRGHYYREALIESWGAALANERLLLAYWCGWADAGRGDPCYRVPGDWPMDAEEARRLLMRCGSGGCDA